MIKKCSSILSIHYISYQHNHLPILNMEATTISPEERKRLDRQRFIGWETQQKLLNSRVLITPANGPNTELAKNLILAGVNVTIYDDAVVTQDDFESNFLVAEKDIGRNRGQAVFQKLKQMNPTGKNELFTSDLLHSLSKYKESDFAKFTMIATSTSDLALAQQWDLFSKRINLPYYNLVCCGLFSFAFISLGSHYQYREMNKKDNTVSKIWSVKSLQLPQALGWEKADKNKEFIAAIAMISKAQQLNILYDPFTGDQKTLGSIVQLGVDMVGEKHRQFLTAFARTYGVDYCPVYSVLGSIISQEVIKIVENQSEPGMNWLIFNSEQGYSNIVKLSLQKERITSQIPLPEVK